MADSVWEGALQRLQEEYPPNLFQMWIRPLQVEESATTLLLLAPNTFFVTHIGDKFMARIREIVTNMSDGRITQVSIRVGSRGDAEPKQSQSLRNTPPATSPSALAKPLMPVIEPIARPASSLNSLFTFDNFVSGKGAQLAHAGCLQAADNPGAAWWAATAGPWSPRWHRRCRCWRPVAPPPE